MSNVISGSRWEEDENCANYAASIGNLLPTFRYKHILLLCLLRKI